MRQPEIPDAGKLAQAQTDINKQTAQTQYQLGATSQTTPFGSLNYEQTGTWADGTPKYTATQTLSPEMQGVVNPMLGGAGQLAQQIQAQSGSPMDLSGLHAMPGAGDFSADRAKVEEALFSRLNPQMAQARQSLEADLINRGVRPGTEAYDRAMGNLGQQENDLRMQSILAGGQEQSRLANLGFQARGQGFNELLAGRNQPINELAALLSGTQIASPNYVNTPQPGVAGVDYAGMKMNQYNLEQQRYNNAMSGLFGAGGNLIKGLFSLSDERTKTDIHRVGRLFNGLPVYVFRYIGEDTPRIGLMAQDVEDVRPEAVHDVGGVLMVDYAKAVL